jgi:hypothetical protein
MNQRPSLKVAVLVDLKTALDATDRLKGFSPHLNRTDYRTLCKVEHRAELRFNEIEAREGGLERIGLGKTDSHLPLCPTAAIKRACWPWRTKDRRSEGQSTDRCHQAPLCPRFFEPAGPGTTPRIRESDLETAIIEHLQPFLLELAKASLSSPVCTARRPHRSPFVNKLVFHN